tara:strand:+ start:192 stop:731 length:540 start_codon:yes stop_codon:yes gene_type:complete
MPFDRKLGESVGLAIDYLVDAIGDASCTLRRAIIMLDIDANPETTQSAIIERLGYEKSMVSRNIEWLADHGVIVRFPCAQDARETRLQLVAFARTSINHALRTIKKDHSHMIALLKSLHESFSVHKPSLRDIKILCVVTTYGKMSRQQIREQLYNGSLATYNRAIANLIEEGLIQENDG